MSTLAVGLHWFGWGFVAAGVVVAAMGIAVIDDGDDEPPATWFMGVLYTLLGGLAGFLGALLVGVGALLLLIALVT